MNILPLNCILFINMERTIWTMVYQSPVSFDVVQSYSFVYDLIIVNGKMLLL